MGCITQINKNPANKIHAGTLWPLVGRSWSALCWPAVRNAMLAPYSLHTTKMAMKLHKMKDPNDRTQLLFKRQ